MPVDSERFTEVTYQTIATVNQTPGYRKRIVFGIKAEYVGDLTEIVRIRDISVQKSDVLRLVILLNECAVSKEHLLDVVRDYVQEL